MNFFFKKENKQLEAVFNWLSKVANSRDRILLEQGKRQEVYYFEFPLKYGDKPKKAKNFNENDITFFIKFSSRQPDINDGQWHLIFQSSELEIYEDKKRFKGHPLPLRFGLSEEAKKKAINLARLILDEFLKKERGPSLEELKALLSAHDFLALRLFMSADLCVALWTNGRLRGSYVVENKRLDEGIITVVVGAASDLRFKPLGYEEIGNTRIEITLFSDVRVPLSEGFVKKNEILAEKG